MAASAIDEAMRNAVAVGADPVADRHSGQFLLGQYRSPGNARVLVRAALACHDVAVAWMTPFISGKDSLNNEFTWVDEDGEKQSMAIPPSLLISAMGQVDDVSQCVTMDLKSAGNAIYLVGKTRKEFGGSQLFEALEIAGGQVPTVDLQDAKQTFAALHAAIQRGDVRACHDLSEGGLAVALSEMAFAGQLGVDVDLAKASGQANLPLTQLLFSETNSRFLIEVEPQQQSQFESGFEGLALTKIGQVTEGPQVVVRDASQVLVDLAWSELFKAWHAPLDWA